MLDLTRTTFSRTFEKEVKVGSTIHAEGRLLQAEIVAGAEVISECSAAASERLVGFSLMSMITPDEVPNVEEGTVPSASPYTIQLDRTNITPGMVRVYDVTGATDLTETGGAPSGGQFQCVDATGLVTFNAAEAGSSVVIYYRYNPTVMEARMLHYEPQINRDSHAVYTRVGVGCGKCQVYTSEFDPKEDFTTVAVGTSLTNTVGGLLGLSGSTDLPVGSRVISVPSAGDPWLGIELSI